jgi:hypothetical protein
MNIHKMIAELQAEKQRLDEAIGALERLSAGNKTKRRIRLERPAHPQSDEPEVVPAAIKARSQSS